MSLSVYATTVELFLPILTNLGNMLAKAKAHAEAKKWDAGVVENLRIAPDMFPLKRQVQLATDFAKNSTARLAGIEPPKFPDEEQTLDELVARVNKTIDWLRTVTAAQLEGGLQRHIVLPLRTRTLEMDGLPFIQRWALPNFYFHVTTTYALLREAGVEVGKQDFLGGV
ncbi:MAG: DUF1993 domain-containing protein [Gammaproteobacteria bacterium]|jgi:hypothetical protein|nr:DUF1993 domain-containing protein [Gammaproteobacteria bacterium]NCW56461.1 DUF1993 domain-containing protein [Gammaproteobacteria bacterium]NDA43522.1 DUF1993 domain-containing protein [Gammaproteobacteria bacterium]NDB25263.1 DUF1993 domain-containing protein [Gammaproteobacteria bacterium]NDF86279.1 DUF1993 domain-containing protein [Gammaproteobacteria bacterium]